MPGAHILIAGVVFAIDEADKNDLADELLSIARPNAPFDAATAADLLRWPSAQPVEFDDGQTYAALRALDNLRDGNRLDRQSELLRIREALRGRLQLPSFNYELELPGTTDPIGWMSFSGSREIGDRVCYRENDWRIVAREDQPSGETRLICEPFMPPPE